MTAKFRIGLFTSAWDYVAWELVSTVHQAVEMGTIPNAEIAFLLSTREKGETPFGDLMINNARETGLPITTFSSLRFKPDLRKQGREAKRAGDPSILETWRDEHDREIVKRITETDLDVLLGYMWEFSGATCRTRTIINLHPALPTGPKGTYKEVIWELIRNRATETGVMMHVISPELDRGAAVSFCHFSIRGERFDPLWEEMGDRRKQQSLDTIAAEEGENNPLFKTIRDEGVRREFPLVLSTIKSLVEGNIRIKHGAVSAQGKIIPYGYDLTDEIEMTVAHNR